MPPRCLSAAERQVATLIPYHDPRTREGLAAIASLTGYTRDYLSALLTRLRRKHSQGRITAYHLGNLSLIGLRLALVVQNRRSSSIAGAAGNFVYEAYQARDTRFYLVYVPSWPAATGAAVLEAVGEDHVVLLGRPGAVVDGGLVTYDGVEGPARAALVDVLLFTILDYNPLASQPDIRNLTPVLALRGHRGPVWLRKRKVLARYHELSRARSLGRTVVLCKREPHALLVVDNECLDTLCSETLLAKTSSIYAVRGEKLTALLLPLQEASLRRIVEAAGRDCVYVARLVRRVERRPIPLDYFEPRKGWMLEPQPLLKHMYVHGLLAKNSVVQGSL